MKRLFFLLLIGVVANAFSATLLPIQLLNPAGSTSGQAVVSTGSSMAPAWGGIAVNGISAIAANSVIANVTASSASPTAVTIPSCSTSTSALQYTNGTGFNCYTSSATTTGTLAQFAATTSAQLAGVISDETGTGVAVFGTSPTIGTPTINQPVINGVTNGSAAAAGSVGQVIKSVIPSGSAVSLTSTVTANVTSISLTAGDWDVWGNVCFFVAGTTTIQSVAGSITTTSATIPNSGTGNAAFSMAGSFVTGQGICMSTGTMDANISATTTYFLTANSNFGVSTNGGYGFIEARRRH
jgi:hypothetical protein